MAVMLKQLQLNSLAWRLATLGTLGVVMLCGCTPSTPNASGSASGTAAAVGATTPAASTSELGKLPVPAGAKVVIVTGDVATYSSDSPVNSVAEECRKLLMQDGWVPYGDAGQTRYFKRGLKRLTATVGPSYDGKTMISYSQEPLPVDIPAPSFAEGVQFATTTKQLNFETAKPLNDIVGFYRSELADAGWKATTDLPIKSGVRDELIFRNPAGDLLTLGISEYKERRRVALRHQSAAEVAEEEKKFKEEMAAKKAKEEAELPKMELALPAKAKEVERSKGRVNFSLPAGEAKAYVDELRKTFESRGWKERATTLEKIGGLVAFTKDDQTVTVSYTDPGIVAADVTLLTSGVEITPPVDAKK
jgi:hypothetical protein